MIRIEKLKIIREKILCRVLIHKAFIICDNRLEDFDRKVVIEMKGKIDNGKSAVGEQGKDNQKIRQVDKILFAYLRVSSREQSWDRQLNQIRGLAVPEENIYYEKASGKDFDRIEYQKLRKRLQAGNVLVITGLDRLGRNYEEMREEWRYLTKQKKVEIWVLNMPLLNSGLKQDLLSAFVAELVLEILSFVSEQERRNIKERQIEGIVAARKRGVVFGRPKKKIDFAGYFAAYQRGEYSCEEVCRRLGIGKTTFYRRRKELIEENHFKSLLAQGEQDYGIC